VRAGAATRRFFSFFLITESVLRDEIVLVVSFFPSAAKPPAGEFDSDSVSNVR